MSSLDVVYGTTAARTALALTLAATSACATTELASEQPSWCATPSPSLRITPSRDDIIFGFVARDALDDAMIQLSRRTFIDLDAAAWRDLVRGGGDPPSGRHLYLVRGGVMTPVDLPEEDFPAYAESAAYYASEHQVSGGLRLTSGITSHIRQSARNYPLLVASPTPVSEILFFCLGGR